LTKFNLWVEWMKIDQDYYAKFYEGKVGKKKRTQQDNMIIEIKDTYILLGSMVKYPSKIDPMHFLVPKRRKKLLNRLLEIEPGTKLQLKLVKETISQKYTVADFKVKA
jgi:hypothetical protein